MKTHRMRLWTAIVLLAVATLTATRVHAQAPASTQEKPCSYTAINGDCTLTRSRTAPAVPPTIHVRHGHTVTVRILDPLPFEHLTLDEKLKSEQVPVDQLSAGFTALTGALSGFAVSHLFIANVAGVDPADSHCPPQGVPRPLSGQQILDCQKFLADRANDAINNGPDAIHPSLTQWAVNALKKVHALFQPVPPHPTADMPTSTLSWQGWKDDFDRGADNALGTPAIPATPTAPAIPANPGSFDADDFARRLALLDVDIAEAADRKSADVRELATIGAQEKKLEAAVSSLTTLKQKMNALRTKVDALTPDADPVTLSIPDDAANDKNDVLETWDLNAENKLAKIAALVKADKIPDAASAEENTLTDKAAKSTVIEFNIDFVNQPHFEISTGLLVPFKPYHTYTVGLSQASATAPPGATPNCPPNDCPVVLQTLTNAVVPDVSVNILPFGEGVVRQQRMAFMLSAAAGYNTANTSAAFGFGPSIAWRMIVISPLAVLSRDQQLAGGYVLGQSAGTATTPMTTNVWKFNPSIGISLRIPLGGGGK
jgi:hypothetical protein